MSNGFKIFLVVTGVLAVGIVAVGVMASQAGIQADMIPGLLLILAAAVIYFLPTLVAGVRGCKAGAGIVIVNIFLGWTFIGWVVALAWAAAGERKLLPVSTDPLLPQMAGKA
jgi:hypothetical protein